MHVKEAILSRRSIREYKDKEIEQEKIELLKQALIWAPSAGNVQARKFFFLTGKAKEKILPAFHQDWVKKVQLIIIACGDKKAINEKFGEGSHSRYNPIDVAASIENLMLQAVELELGSCWIGKVNLEETKKILKLPENLDVICAIAVGYPAEKGEIKARKNIIEEMK
ncbi:MAG: nitroreductase family protein [archaeon]